MNIYLAAFTQKGAALCQTLLDNLPGDKEGFAPARFARMDVRPMEATIGRWTEERFQKGNALVFIGAAGIAVRAIAPFVAGKDKDPAVLCVDELGKHVIPLLSGHMGGANALAGQIALLLGATAVITTATDLEDCFAFDTWAVENGYVVANKENIKHVSAALLQGKTVGITSDFPIVTGLPQGVKETGLGEAGVLVSLFSSKPYPKTLHLIPRCLVLGVGCRRDIAPRALEEQILAFLRQYRLPMESFRAMASVSLKKDEPALVQFSAKYRLPFLTYQPEELEKLPGNFNASPFVKEKVGVDNVCERAAVIAAKKLLIPKTKGEGVTMAVAKLDWKVAF